MIPSEIARMKPLGPIAAGPNVLVSIVIPTYQHIDLLKACVKSIVAYTDLSACEVVIVANGCTDGTVEYLKTLPPPFRHLTYAEPLGYTAASNAGIRAARGDYVLLLNNDTALLPQERNAWIEILLDPLRKDPKAGITGPVKFSWDCGGIERRAIAFWCAMMPRKLFTELGALDEVFSPGMGEDGDFSIKAEQAGYRLVQVPENGCAEFGKGIPNQTFPIYHAGSGTFSDKDYSAIKTRNDRVLVERYGLKEVVLKDDLESIYKMCLEHKCDTNRLFPTLRAYTEKCNHVTEFGVRGVFTTWAFLAGRPKRMVSYDIEYNTNIEGAKKEAAKAGISFEFRLENTLKADIEPTDLLFVDTTHTYAHLKAELDRHAGKVSKLIAIHDTESFGLIGEDQGPGEKQAIDEFLAANLEWTQKEHIKISNGLTILERKAVAVSIVIPTCGKDWEAVLKRCLEEVWKSTILDNKEVIVVANGAPDAALEFVKTFAAIPALHLRLIQFPAPIGYIRAVNAGIEASVGEHVVLLDDDSFLMGQHKDQWIQILHEPFQEDPKMAASGPASMVYDDLGLVLHSGCTMYSTAALKKIGLFDEAFNPGYMGDEDLSIRLRKAGFSISEVPKGAKTKYVNGIREGSFPLLHMGNVNTMDKQADLPLIVKNRALLYERHAPKADAGTQPVTGVERSKENQQKDQRSMDRNKATCPDCGNGVQWKDSLCDDHWREYLGTHKNIEQHNPKDDIEAPHLESEAASMGLGDLSVWSPTGGTPISLKPKVSIIIPTAFAKLEELLKPNLESIITYTDMDQMEVIVVANGCTDDTEGYVKSLGPKFRVISFPDAMGYTRATNEGIKVSTGDFIVLYNNDNVLLPQPKNDWMNKLLDPFRDNPKMGITGPLQLHDDYANEDVIIGFCLCISRKVMQEAMAHTGGLMDEIYSPGGGEDIDLCCKVKAKGYITRQVPVDGKQGMSHQNTGDFMIYHKNNQTFKDIEEYTRFIIKKNGLVNAKKYNKNLKLNLGSGGIEYPGFLSVDLNDRRANIIMDITKLDFPENSVSEMIAIHVLEHLSPYIVLDTLKLWNKILKPGGKLTMELPDLESLCRRYVEANTGERYGLANCIYGSVNTTSEGEPSDITSPHLFGWDKQQIADQLWNAGFTRIEFMPERFPHPEPPNMSVDAYKP